MIKDLLDDETEHFIAKGTFKFALAYVNQSSGLVDSSLLDDETYFTVDFYRGNYIRQRGGYILYQNSIPTNF